MPIRDSDPLPDDRDAGAPEEGLDRLLQAADWPETPPLAVARLEKTWAGVSPTAIARRRRRWLAAAAAVVLVASGLVAWWPGSPPREVNVVKDHPHTPVKEAAPPVVEASAPAQPSRDLASSPGEKKRTRRPRTRRQWLAHRQQLLEVYKIGRSTCDT